jgi:hypothetical protein
MREDSSAAHAREHDLDMSYRASKDLASPVDRIVATMALMHVPPPNCGHPFDKLIRSTEYLK